MLNLINQIVARAKADRQRIVLPEGTEERTLKAATQILTDEVAMYRIDIWNNKSTSQTAMDVDAGLSALGLRRRQCNDVDDVTGLKHKIMRYEGILDLDNELVYNT